MLIPALYFYDVKYRPILSKKRHRSKSGEITNIEKYFFFNFFEMGRTLPKCMGWAEPSPTTYKPSPSEQCSPLFTCYVNSRGLAGTMMVVEKADLWWRRGGAVGGGGCNGAASGGWGHGGALLTSFSSLCRGKSLCFFSFLFFFCSTSCCCWWRWRGGATVTLLG
jgi:hypothetical protein